MKKKFQVLYEEKMFLPGKGKEEADYLIEMGKKGWQLVQVINYDSIPYCYALRKSITKGFYYQKEIKNVRKKR